MSLRCCHKNLLLTVHTSSILYCSALKDDNIRWPVLLWKVKYIHKDGENAVVAFVRLLLLFLAFPAVPWKIWCTIWELQLFSLNAILPGTKQCIHDTRGVRLGASFYCASVLAEWVLYQCRLWQTCGKACCNSVGVGSTGRKASTGTGCACWSR